MNGNSDHVPIPGPRGIPFLGNIFDVEAEIPNRSLEQLAEKYGPIYRLTINGESQVFISSRELVNEVCDEERFAKKLSQGLIESRNCLNDGIFTAYYPGEENWAIAHRILTPAFGPLSVRGMFDDMYDIASQLALKWARQGPRTPIMVTHDFTRTTLDTIALCAMGCRFNSFYTEEIHPFVVAMINLLRTSGERSRRPPWIRNLPSKSNKKYWEDIAFMREMSQKMVDERRNHPVDKSDLLNGLILGRDPQTGQGFTDESIVDNMITFLIAGHETTSGLLSFIFYFLLKDPLAYIKAQEEVDSVIGRRKVCADDLSHLPYITAIVRETLRLRPAPPDFSTGAHPTKNKEDPVTLGNGKYVIGKDESIITILNSLHRDPAVWGPDAEEFKPERMTDEKFEKLPKNCWKPFGNGMRGCIGRTFAWQETLLIVALLLQNFNFEMHDPSYELQIQQTLTLKPKDFFMRATLRDGLDATKLSLQMSSSSQSFPLTQKEEGPRASDSELKPMYIFYGSNTGTCETFARNLATDAVNYGFRAGIDSLDSAQPSLPKDGPVVVITASYEGQPPDNAVRFFKWLNDLDGSSSLEGVKYAVFGCGHHDWQATFHHVPKVVDQLVDKHGGQRLCEIGLGDAANTNLVTSFETWVESTLMPAILAEVGGPDLQGNQHPRAVPSNIEIKTGIRASTLGLELEDGIVRSNELLSAPAVPEKRLVQFKLPENMAYECGDYLIVLPVNSPEIVRRALGRLNLHTDSMISLAGNQRMPQLPVSLPPGSPISVYDFFSSYVELTQPLSRPSLGVLADAAPADSAAQSQLRDWIGNPAQFIKDVVEKKVGLLDLLMRYPDIDITMSSLLPLLPPMRARQYSISSSPLVSPSECSITFSVIDIQREQGMQRGISSGYLAGLQPGERVQIGIRPSHSSFKPPQDLKTPMIMICAGSGIAPFRGFVMDRAKRILKQKELSGCPAMRGSLDNIGEAVLYVGCRTPGQDDIHASELSEWEKAGAVRVRWVYSRPENAKGRYVQSQIIEDRKELVKLLEHDASLYICGSLAVASEVRDALRTIYLQELEEKRRLAGNLCRDCCHTKDQHAVDSFFEMLRVKGKYATDVFN